MNPVLGYLLERPGLLAGGLPILLFATLGAVQYWRQGKTASTPPTDSLPYYRSIDGMQSGSVPEHPGGFWSRVSLWATDHLVTHFAVASVLGAVALGGLALASLLSRLKFASVWTILAGIVLSVLYLAFVGVVIVVVNGVSERALRGIRKNGR